jgi:hypothetical protein
MTGPAARASHRRRYGLPLPHMLLADPTEPSWDPGGGFVLRRLSGLPVIPGPPQKPASVDRTSAPNAPIWTVLATDLRSAKGVQNGGYRTRASGSAVTLCYDSRRLLERHYAGTAVAFSSIWP